MSKYLVDSTEMTAIADAIRQKDGTQTTMTVDQMPTRIQNIPSGGGGGTDYMEQRVQGTLTSYVIPNTCTKISQYSFCGMPLTSVTIPNTITQIGSYAFYSCKQLTSISIPSSVTKIGNYSFSWSNLTSVTIPDSVTEIGQEAFYSCEQLTSISIPSSVTKIGTWAFYRNSNMTSVTFGMNMNAEFSNYVFDWCTKLTTLNNFSSSIFKPKNTSSTLPYIARDLFGYTALVGDIYIDSAEIEYDAFDNRYSAGILYIHLTQDDTSLISSSYTFGAATASWDRSFNFDHCRLVVPYSSDHSILTAYQTAFPNYSTIMIEETP